MPVIDYFGLCSNVYSGIMVKWENTMLKIHSNIRIKKLKLIDLNRERKTKK